MSQSIPGVTSPMLSADYWLHKCAQMNPGWSREACQQALREHSTSFVSLVDTLAFKTPQELVHLSGRDERSLYDDCGQPVGDEGWARILENDSGRIYDRFVPALVVELADVRRHATDVGAFRDRKDKDLDQFQETVLHLNEPVLCAADSADGHWTYIVSTTYSGWVKHDRFARVDQRTLQSVIDADDVWVVTQPGIQTRPNPYDQAVSMRLVEFGAWLPVHAESAADTGLGHVRVPLPVRQVNGDCDIRDATIRRQQGIRRGYLPFSREAAVRSTFALLGERYGWGGMYGMHDCSSLVMDVYRLMGIQLPRDTGDQELALPHQHRIAEDANTDDRYAILATCSPGDLLYMPGHVMLYLGEEGGRHYVIHDFTGYSEVVDGQRMNRVVHEIMVSPLELDTESGKTYLACLTGTLNLFGHGGI